VSSPPLLLRGREAVRTAPLTAGYVTVLVTTTAVASTVSAQAGARLLSAFSTNLHELARVPMRVLVGSAFWAGGWTGLTL
jgi:Rhomboid-like protein